MRLLGQFDRPFTQFLQSYYFFKFVQVFLKEKPRFLSGVYYNIGDD
jgi:hypothetical protein